MTDKKLNRLLLKAEKAYAKGDKRKGARLVDQILRQDFNHAGTWQLLFRLFGKGRAFTEFQRSFTLQYYPNQLYQLRNPGMDELPASPGQPEKKPPFWRRLFRKPQAAAPKAVPPAAQSEASSAAEHRAAAALGESHRAASASIEGPRASPIHPPPVEPSPLSWQSLMEQPTPDRQALPTAAFPSAALTAAQRIKMLSSRDKIHVVVVDDIPQTRETVIRTLRFQEDIEVVGTAANGVQAIQLVRELLPDVIIMDVNMPDMDGITATDLIKREIPHAQIIILTVQDDVDYIRRAMMAGARDFLAKPPVIEELVAAVQRAAAIARQERQKLPPPGEASLTPANMLGRGKIISVYSPRGGSGCTTLACNLAAALHSDDTPVVIVDGNLQFGDVEVFFNVQGRSTIVDLAQRINQMDTSLVEEVLVEHSSGIKLLLPSRPERSELVTGQQFNRILAFLCQCYPYVIVDTSHRLNDITLAALDSSDLVLLVTTQDIPSIARIRKFLDLLPAMELDKSRILAVMNQYEANTGVEPDKVGQAFRLKISAVIPRGRDKVIPAITRGQPFMLQKEIAAHPMGRAMLTLVEEVRQRLVELDRIAAQLQKTD